MIHSLPFPLQLLLFTAACFTLSTRACRSSFWVGARSKARAATILLLLALLPGSLPLFGGTPTVNGLFFGDGDLNDYAFLLSDTGGGSKGKVYYGLDGNTVYIALVVNKNAANDAVFGKGSGQGAPDDAYLDDANWNKHEFLILEGSDHATFGLECGATADTPDYNWGLDLLYDLDGDLDPTEADWRGDHNGPDSPVAPADLRLPPAFTADTSLAWDMNNTNWDVTLGGTRAIDAWKSPDGPLPLFGDGRLTPAGDNYDINDDSTVAGNYNTDFDWEWSLVYEFSFDRSACTEGITINPGTSHNSPSKDGVEDTTYPDCLTNPDPDICRSLVFDWGDLPDGPYPTLLASNGPFHEVTSPDNVYMGTAPDSEPDGQPAVDALGDNNDLNGNDEDGVTFLTPLVPGVSANIEVDAPLGGFLTAWIDFNSDGDFLDADEQITTADLALAAGVNTLNIASVPASATGVMAARFRITTAAGQGGDSPTGAATTGEIEDYMLACIGSTVWNDLDGDGIHEPLGNDGLPGGGDDELGVPNVVVNLLSPVFPFTPIIDGNFTPVTATTDANGNYEFCGLPTVGNSGLPNPGEYRVLFNRPASFIDFTLTNQGADDTVDSDADQDLLGVGLEGLAPLDTLPAISLVASQVDDTIDAGLRAVTVALITSAGAYTDGGSIVFEFSTGYEALTGSFEVLRYDRELGDYVTVTELQVPALQGAPQGGVYRVVDDRAPFDSRLDYVIVEHQTDGRTQAYGPYAVEVSPRGARAPLTDRFAARPHRSQRLATRLVTARQLAKPETRRDPELRLRTRNNPERRRDIASLQIEVQQSGLHRLSAAEIADVLGLAQGQVRSFLRSGRVALENQGRAVAWLPSNDSGDGLYFYGQAIDSLYTLNNVYQLQLGRAGERMSGGGSASLFAGSSSGTFVSTELFEEDRIPAISSTLETEVDHWYWDGINATSSDTLRDFAVTVPDAAGGSAVLRTRLTGISNGAANRDHHAIVRVNGAEIGTAAWGGMSRHEAEMTFDGALLTPTTTIEIEGILDEGSSESIFFIDGFDLEYERSYRAVDDRLRCVGSGSSEVTVRGFATADLIVLDLTDPATPALVSGRVELGSDGYQVSFRAADDVTPYLVTTESVAFRPAGLRRAVRSAALKATHHRYDHVVIAPEAWRSEADDLATYRTSRGLRSLTVSLEEVYDTFSHGIVTPWAIRDFLIYAHANWSQAPDYALLAGRGTFDPRDLLGGGDHRLPVVLVGTPYGLISSDNVLADLTGDDSVPEVAIGRLPIVGAAELATYLAKLEAYDSANGDWRDRAVLLADNEDAAGDFPAQSDNVAAVLGSYRHESIHLSEMTPSDARVALMAAWNRGAQLVNYVGHGGVTQAAAEGLLRVSDMDALSNGDRLPIVSALTCVIGRSDVPNVESLAEALVTDADGGAIAVWAPTGLSLSGAAQELNLLYAAALDSAPPATPLGRLMVQVLTEFGASGGAAQMLDTYGVVGDPAVQLP